ncbi:PTS transporter subunit EIIB [Mycoplasma phocimorsus]|uniref:PTS transporter subunit EIIB n=2 Tax=Mycoplasma phocimorsus TaxID=3045839 RepID=A0AAJ1PSC2_9MOLU|nr:PTS transporter subunit EIIB [Mycoplasma phocimorsus]MDJ1645833.1 PTS transporter subunit EIIB [Mycoplasma phocimorsus]MDJ1647000.1 PTS transporter subunit EIIB [Mycoplasma phocimorsus]MDJ1648020.1 PTS transporter subunit EIIB [Mycoplasma phocimorsus]MDJ1649135.1 PTS transporter subunit EIIB [Mycoplasma phocimorsus]
MLKKAPKKSKKINNNISIKINKLIENLGSKQNISFAEANMSRIKIGVYDINLVNIDAIQKEKRISGIMKQSSCVTLIVGRDSTLIQQKINEVISEQ